MMMMMMNINEGDEDEDDDDDDDDDGHDEDGEMVVRMMIPGGLVGPSKGPTRMTMVGPFSVHWRFPVVCNRMAYQKNHIPSSK